jgi:hypothetical protein
LYGLEGLLIRKRNQQSPMARSTDERREPDHQPAARSDLPLPEQTFFRDPMLDRLMGMTIALAAEVYILRSRLHVLERMQQGPGLERVDDALSPEDADAQRKDAEAFVAHLLQPALGEQQARGPL